MVNFTPPCVNCVWGGVGGEGVVFECEKIYIFHSFQSFQATGLENLSLSLVEGNRKKKCNFPWE